RSSAATTPAGAVAARNTRSAISARMGADTRTDSNSEWGDTELRWAGIDEAGYGPNLGPLVMTAVVAETSEAGDRARALDLWQDLAGTVDRAGGDPTRLWVDDSKAILRGGKGRDRLEAACLAAVHATGLDLPGSFRQLLEVLGAG